MEPMSGPAQPRRSRGLGFRGAGRRADEGGMARARAHASDLFRSGGPYLALWVALGLAACADPPLRPSTADGSRPIATRADRLAAAEAATSAIGARYRYGGATPAGFDCSGLVVYSYASVGISDLPQSAARLERLARPVSLRDLEPGDLLFFRLDGHKTSHVAIYVGDRAFVHAPSSGKRVERVGFDDVYWGPRLGRAGRL